MVNVPFLDIKAQYLSIKNEIDSAVLDVLQSTQFVLGPKVSEFENSFAQYCQTKFAAGVNSGTSALHLALLAAGIKPEDEVITVTFTFVATVASILYTGAKPVFVDIDPQTYTIDVNQIEKAITPKTKAIIPVHLYGHPADMDPIMEIAKKYKLKVIEDAAQAHGAEYKGRKAGSIGDLGCFSFYPGKNLGAYGEGGAIVTSNSDYIKTIKMLRDWGAEKKYQHVLKGYNYRMEGFQGAILKVKLNHLEEWTNSRRKNAHKYNELLNGSAFVTPSEASNVRHVYHVYAIRVTEREKIQQKLLEKGIQTNIHYPYPVHILPAYEDLGYKAGMFPNSEKAAKEILSLPMYPELSDEQIQYVVNSLKEIR